MPNIEKKILSWVDACLPLIVALIFTVMGIWARMPMLDVVSGDSRFFLLPWYEKIRENGLSTQVGNYNILYQMMIFLLTRLPLKPLHAYKFLSILFDYLLAAGVGLLTAEMGKDGKLWKAVLAYGAALLSPIVILNSAAWAQCDSIFCCFAVFALLALAKERWSMSMILMGLAFSFKLQAVFLLPVFLFVYYQRRRFTVLQFALIPATMILAGLPLVFFGRNILDIFTIYSDQTGTYPNMALNYPSVWLLLAAERNAEQYGLLKSMAIFLTVAILAVLMIRWLRRKVEATGQNLIRMAFLLAYTCVLFLPAMHERYGYPYEILAIVLAVLQPKTVPLCAGLIGISLCTYGSYLFDTESFRLVTLTVLNLLVYCGYMLTLNRQMEARKDFPDNLTGEPEESGAER